MCIAIANYKGKPITKEQFENCWDNNPNGAGLLYIEDNQLKVFKELTDWKKIYEKYVVAIEQSNCLLHFRVKSAGKITLGNIHPFMVHKNLGFIHNGTIMGLPVEGDHSDTWSLNQHILKKLPRGFQSNTAMLNLIDEYIGHSKIAMMSKKGKFTIIGKDRMGTITDKESGNWFSNNSHLRKNTYYYQGNVKVSKNSYGLPKLAKPAKTITTKTVSIPRKKLQLPVFPKDESRFNPRYEVKDRSEEFLDSLSYYTDQVPTNVYISTTEKMNAYFVYSPEGIGMPLKVAVNALLRMYAASRTWDSVDELIGLEIWA